MKIFKIVLAELGITKEQLQDKEIQKFIYDYIARKYTGQWIQWKNGNAIIEINKNNGTSIRTILNDEDYNPEFPENIDMNISTYCENNCNFCLTEEAKLCIGDKKIPINNIKKGDAVNSFNIESKIIENKPVTCLFRRDYEGDLIVLETDQGNILKLTPNHKVFTNRGYIRADELTVEDELISEIDEQTKN